MEANMKESKDISVVMNEAADETKVPLIFQCFVELALGIFMIIFQYEMPSVIFIVVGALMVCYGVFDLIAFVTNNRDYSFRRGLTTGVLVTIIGVAFIVQAEKLSNLLSIIIGALILIESLVNCRRAIILKNFGDPRWKALLIVSLAVIVLGILICIFPGMFGGLLFLTVGIGIIFVAILDIIAILGMSVMRGRAKRKMEEEGKVVEATAINLKKE